MEPNMFLLSVENDCASNHTLVRWVYFDLKRGVHCTQYILSGHMLAKPSCHAEEVMELAIRDAFLQLLDYLDTNRIDYSTATI